MRTLFIFSNASHYGGGEKSLETLLPELAKHYSLTIFVENMRHLGAVRAMRLVGCEIVLLPSGNHPIAWLRALRQVVLAALRRRPDVLLANCNKGGLLLALARRFLPGRPATFLYVRDFTWRYQDVIFGLLGNTQIIVPSPAVFEHVAWREKFRGMPVRVVANAVWFGAASKSPRPYPEPYILCFANIARWKGIDRLIEAFTELAKSNADLRLVIAGNVHDAAYHAELLLQIKRAGLSARIALLDFVESVGPLYEHAEQVVVPSISLFGGPETFGRTIIEAWSHRRPVVAFDTGGPRFLIENGEDGFLVPEGDWCALAGCMGRLHEDGALRERLGRKGQARARSEFSVDSVAAKLRESLDGTSLALAANRADFSMRDEEGNRV